MKRTESFSLYAFIIALLVHLIIILLFILFDRLTAIAPEQTDTPPQEQRFRLSLKERPDVSKEAIVPNQIPQTAQTPSIPRGEQLRRPPAPKAPSRASVPVPLPRPLPDKPAEPVAAPLPSEPEPKKAFVRHTAKTVATIEKTPVKREEGLYDILSKADGSAKNIKSTTNVNSSIKELYGDKFSELSEGEQKYILDNQEIMRRITQEVLNDYGRSKIPDSVRVNDTNMIEFYLHPDGSISGLRLLKNSQLSVLDETTKNTILYAYHRYPRPEQKTLIRYRVWYNLTGY